MPDTARGPAGRAPSPTGPFGEGAPDLPADAAELPSHPGDSAQHVARSARGPRPPGDEDTAERPPHVDRPASDS